jgi:hypothetical protein
MIGSDAEPMFLMRIIYVRSSFRETGSQMKRPVLPFFDRSYQELLSRTFLRPGFLLTQFYDLAARVTQIFLRSSPACICRRVSIIFGHNKSC